MTRSSHNTRIIHVPRRFAQDEWGGTESVLLNLCRQQGSNGFQPEIHTSKALNSTSEELWQDIPISRYNYCYPYLGLSSEERAALDLKSGNLISLGLFRSLAASQNIRIFHAHCLKRLGGEVLTLARLKNKPCVVTIHGNVFDVPEAESKSHTQITQRHLEWGKPFGMLFQSRSLLEKADGVICVGKSEYFAAKQKLNHDRIYYLPNGVNVNSFKDARWQRQNVRDSLDIRDDEILFGCISRIDPQKDQLTLVRAFAKYRRKNSKARLLLAGPSTVPEFFSQIESEIDAQGLRNSVIILPPLEPESSQHANLLAAMDCFILPSRHEPFGIVVLEAWSAHTPVITSKVGGLLELVDEGRDGLQFTPSDVDDLVAKMDTIANSQELRQSLADRGFEKARDCYSWESANAQLEEIYATAEERVGKRPGKAAFL